MADDEPPDLGPDEEKRRAVIEPLQFDRLRTDPAFERVSHAVAALCDVSMANVSVMEDDRQCVVGRVGFDRDFFRRDQSFCAYTLANRELTVIENAAGHEDFEESPYVLEAPYIHFYVGVPLEIQGIPAGTLCALDDEPRELTETMRATLSELARLTERYLEMKVVADSPDDPRHRLAGELTSMAAMTGMLDARLSRQSDAGELIGSLKDAVDTSFDAVSDWIEEEHESYFE